MQNWEKFEINATEYLQAKCGSDKVKFQRQGGSDASTPDIKVFINNNNVFNIEAKMSPSQAGQFVVRNAKNTFTYSSGNRTAANPFSNQIISHMNQNYDDYSNFGTQSMTIDCPNQLAYDWIANHYQQKKCRHLIVAEKPEGFLNNSNYIRLVPLTRIREEFSVETIFRIKRSGTRRVPKRDRSPVRDLLGEKFSDKFKLSDSFEVSFDAGSIPQEQPLSNEFHLSERDYNRFVVRKRSQTFNANIIFKLVHLSPKTTGGFDELDALIMSMGG